MLNSSSVTQSIMRRNLRGFLELRARAICEESMKVS